jgi:hypothetical protein
LAPLGSSAQAKPEATNVTVAEAIGAVGAHAGNASPEANVGADGAGVGLVLGLEELPVTLGVNAGTVASPGPLEDEGARLEVHADNATRTATRIVATRFCKDSLPRFAAKG